MSNKQQLQINNTKVASLIETLRGKAVGSVGGDIETCTVQFGTSSYASLNVYATILDDDGNITAYTIEGAYSGTIENVLCHSIICIYDQASKNTSAEYGAVKVTTVLTISVYKITANLGETAIINLDSSGGY